MYECIRPTCAMFLHTDIRITVKEKEDLLTLAFECNSLRGKKSHRFHTIWQTKVHKKCVQPIFRRFAISGTVLCECVANEMRDTKACRHQRNRQHIQHIAITAPLVIKKLQIPLLLWLSAEFQLTVCGVCGGSAAYGHETIKHCNYKEWKTGWMKWAENLRACAKHETSTNHTQTLNSAQMFRGDIARVCLNAIAHHLGCDVAWQMLYGRTVIREKCDRALKKARLFPLPTFWGRALTWPLLELLLLLLLLPPKLKQSLNTSHCCLHRNRGNFDWQCMEASKNTSVLRPQSSKDFSSIIQIIYIWNIHIILITFLYTTGSFKSRR